MQTIQKNLRAYRNEIKGLAILWVVFFHAQLGLDGFLYNVQKIGYGGVDIFFFLSGFGLYHSLERSSDLNGYFRRRVVRILPAYVPFCLVWLGVMLSLNRFGLADTMRVITGNLFMIGFWSGSPININWYLSALMISLLIAPVLHAALQCKQNFCKRSLLLLGFSFFFSLAFVENDFSMAVSRLPVFVSGMVFAGWNHTRPNEKGIAVGLSAAFVLGLTVLLYIFKHYQQYLLSYAMYWYPFVLITPALCAGAGWLFSRCPGVLLHPLRWLGTASFEIFLFNAWIELLGKKYGLCSSPADWLLWSALSLGAGLLYHMVIEKARLIFCKKS